MPITQNGVLKKDDNDYPVMGGTSSVDNTTIVNSAFNPTTRRLLTDQAGAGSGTVTSVSVVTANGFAGTVATATTTPAITLTTTLNTPVLAGNGTALIAATTTGSGSTVVLNTAPTFATSITGSYLDASEILITDGSKNIISAAVATYPSLTELTYLKGVTSAIQTQLNAKQATITFGTGVLTALGNNVGSAGAFITFNGDAGTPSALVGTNITGTAASFTAGTATLANTVASANEATDTTCFPLFITASGTQTLATKNNTSFTFNSNTGALGATSFVGAGTSLTGIPYALTGTANQVTLSGSTGNITFSLPNDLRITSASVGTNADSIPTLSSTSTLTNKTLTSPTLTTPSAFTTGGTITLAENTSIALDPAGSADGKWTGISVTATAGYTQAFGDLVYLDPTDSRWELCDANSAAGADGDSRGIIGMVVSTGTDGTACTILLQGIIRADAKFPSFTVNNPIYVSETAGSVTQTQPTTTDVVIRVVGAALTADEMYFNPDFFYITHT